MDTGCTITMSIGLKARAQQSPMTSESALVEQAGPPGNDNAILLGYVVPLQQPGEVPEVDDSRSWAKVVAFSSCCFQGLVFTLAAFVIARHYGHIHILHGIPDIM